MNTPNIDGLFAEVSLLRNKITHLQMTCDKVTHHNALLQAKYDQYSRELKQKQESWNKAANYRDECIELRKQLADQKVAYSRLEHEFMGQRDEKAKLANEVVDLEKRINENYTSAHYHMRALDRLALFVKPKDLTSEGVVVATINWINRLLEENKRAQVANGVLGAERNIYRQRINNIRTLISSEL